MKKLILIGIVLLIMFCDMILAKDYSFRKTNWGMNKQEVMRTERGNPIKNETIESKGEKVQLLIYRSSINKLKCNIIYFFDLKTGLYKAKYEIDSFENPSQYTFEAEKFIKLLSEKYGKPVNTISKFGSNHISWKADSFSVEIHYYEQDDFFMKYLDIIYTDIKNYSDL